jgi:membrane protease YdiL (CAAX protease family)
MTRGGAKRGPILTDLVLVLPLLIGYAGGLILLGPGVQNGADVINPLVRRLAGDRGLIVFNLFLVVLFIGLIHYLKRKQRFDTRQFLPTVLESTVYALLMGSVILFVMRKATLIALAAPGRPPPLHGIVISMGAGVNEELFFRVCLFGVLAYLAEDILEMKRWAAVLVAVIVSSAAFSLAHHLGGEPFTRTTFVYRFLAGILFSCIYRFRSFAIAAYTHTMYDIFVLVIRTG